MMFQFQILKSPPKDLDLKLESVHRQKLVEDPCLVNEAYFLREMNQTNSIVACVKIQSPK